MKIKIELAWFSIPHQGYTYYDNDPHKLVKKYCRWWLYPAFALMLWFYYKKLWLYHTLNDYGIMHTPEYCVMRFLDLWRKQEC